MRLQLKTQPPQSEDRQLSSNEAGNDTAGVSSPRSGKMGSIIGKAFSIGRKLEHPRPDVIYPAEQSMKTAKDIEVTRSSPRPILSRQSLPKTTFSSLEEYGDDLLTRSICTARPSREHISANDSEYTFDRLVRAKHRSTQPGRENAAGYKQEQVKSCATDHMDVSTPSALSIDLKEHRSDSESFSSKMIPESHMHLKSSSAPSTGYFKGDSSASQRSIDEIKSRTQAARKYTESQTKESLPKLSGDINDRAYRALLTERIQEDIPRRLKIPPSSVLEEHAELKSSNAGHFNHATGDWCSNDPAASMTLMPELYLGESPAGRQIGMDASLNSQLCEPFTSDMSPPSYLDNIVDGGLRPTITTAVGADAQATQNPRLPPESSNTTMADPHAERAMSGASGSSSQESLLLQRRPRSKHSKHKNGSLRSTFAGKRPQHGSPSRSLHMGAGNSTELCGPVPRLYDEDQSQRVYQMNEERFSAIYDNLRPQAQRYEPPIKMLRTIAKTNQSTFESQTGDSSTSLQNALTDGPSKTGFGSLSNLSDEGVRIEHWYPTTPVREWNPFALSTTHNLTRSNSAPQERSKYDFENCLEDDDVVSLPPGNRVNKPRRPLYKRFMSQRGSDRSDSDFDGWSPETMSRIREGEALQGYHCRKQRDRTSRGFRQIIRADHVIATVFSKAFDRYRSFRPVKFHWQHSKWIQKGQDNSNHETKGKDWDKDGDNGSIMSGPPESDDLDKLEEIERHRRDSIVG